MRLATTPDPITRVLEQTAAQLHDASAAFLATSLRIGATPLDGPDWATRYDDALALTGSGWRPADLAVRAARDAVAALGTDPRAGQAQAALTGAINVLTGAYRDISMILRRLPAELTPEVAAGALGDVADAGSRMASGVEQAALALDALASGHPVAGSRD
jgi:hypothetical protein